jgi:DNA-binding MarR family transcriptional regulator
VTDAPGATDGAESLPDLFWSVARRLRHSSAESLATWELSPSQARALRVLEHHGRMRLSELSDHLRIAARSTTEVVDELERKEIVRRSPDPSDRRATLVELTDHGVATARAIGSARAAEAERLFGRLSAPQRALLADLLRALQG